jgi:hypothetical protein
MLMAVGVGRTQVVPQQKKVGPHDQMVCAQPQGI